MPVTRVRRTVMSPLWVAVAALMLAHSSMEQDLTIGVVIAMPQLAQQVGTAVSVALEGAAEASVVAPVEPDEPLAVARHVCELASLGVAGVVCDGGAGARLAAGAAARAGVPLLLVGDAPVAADWEALAMYPHRDLLAEATLALCRAKGWHRAVLLHEGGAEAAALLAPEPEPLHLLARQLPPPDDDTLLRNLLLVLKKFGEVRFIVWCEAECAIRVLETAQRVGLLAERHAYIVLALNMHAYDLADYSHGGANITGMRLFDPTNDEVADTMGKWRDLYSQRLGEEIDEEWASIVQQSPPSAILLAHRAAALATEVLGNLSLPPTDPPNCDTAHGSFHADTLLNYLRSEEWVGTDAGGPISWEADGGRRSVQLEMVELARGGQLVHVAVWDPVAGLVWQRNDPPAPAPPPDSMTNLTFNILITLNEPYVMRQESTRRLSGNNRYEGFCIELIQRLAEILKFNYTFIEQQDRVTGTKDNVTGKWNGMLGRLMTDESIDFAITDLTITAEREQAVDFTTPFMNLGIGILFRKPEPPAPELFAFLLPFSNGVWLCLGFAYLGTSLLLYVVGRLCHEEWQNPYPCIEEPPALENQFTLANALWFNLGAVLMQGSEIAPAAVGTRSVASIWWMFALVVTSSYTANLATLLAKKSTTELINSVEDLVNNSLNIDYGAKKGGSTYTFFEHSQSPLYKEMYEHMRKRTMPSLNEEGIAKVKNETYYAFLMESTTIEYVVERDCDVTKVGDPLDSKGYGIAMKKDSQYRQALNVALLNLQEAGVLREMKTTWWNEKHGGGACKDVDERGALELSMANFLGLFLVLVVGCSLGVVISCIDLAVAAARRARESGESFSSRFAAELRFVFRFEQSVKPLQGPLSASSSSTEQMEGESLAAEGEADAELETEESRLRSSSLQSSRRRRRSSMHAASLRLARHTARDSRTPSQHQRTPPN